MICKRNASCSEGEALSEPCLFRLTLLSNGQKSSGRPFAYTSLTILLIRLILSKIRFRLLIHFPPIKCLLLIFTTPVSTAFTAR